MAPDAEARAALGTSPACPSRPRATGGGRQHVVWCCGRVSGPATGRLRLGRQGAIPCLRGRQAGAGATDLRPEAGQERVDDGGADEQEQRGPEIQELTPG